MLDLHELTIKLLEEAKNQIQQRLETEKINATGRTSQSFRVEDYDSGVRLVMGGDNTAPLGTLEIGRDAGKIPYGFTDILEQWSRDKGIQFNDERDRRTFAWFLGQRIKREGTLRHTAPVDVYSTVVREMIPQLQYAIVTAVRDNFKEK